ncbi:hypothetical protein ACET3X_001522 [Alternaria dauci]|uniref:TauD/TfdA-like domain-containing protein n=1 Tax=Alternaria dauci TaxID=48095 RepID=A0ABR3UXL3_9PLEO
MTAPTKQGYPAPQTKTGALDAGFKFEETTPVIGREYPGVNIVEDILNASNAEELIRDLAITISERGVVFFRAQDNLTDDLQKSLVHRLGLLTGKPADSTLHIHPILNNTSEFGVDDAQISTISSLARKNIYKHENNGRPSGTRRYDAAQWHSDIQFEPTGGDTLWASGYEIYDRFSKAYQTFFEGLTATFVGDGFIRAAEANPEKVKIYEQERGSPKNVGRSLSAVHPVVRTNPVTGWKSIFALGPFPKYINELHDEESAELLKKFRSVITENHDLQVRFKWRNKNDIAIWDNRSAFHSATFDYDDLGERFGNRAVGIGEAPYLDANSRSRTEALAERKVVATGHEKNGVAKSETVSA